MRLVFIGASAFGLRCLQECLGLPELQVSGVVTAPQTFSISYRPSGVTNVLHADVAGLANAHKIPVQTLEHSMNDPDLFEVVAAWAPDAFLVAGWYHMIPKRWREFAPAYGLHASLLPDYTGGAPLVWAIINGESKTRITLFQMDGGVDAGPIAGQKEEVIYPDDTIATLYARIEQRGLELLREAMPSLARGTLKLKPQDESKRRIVPQRGPEDGLINWAQDAASIDRFIRAQTNPYPGAFTTLKGKPLHIWQAKVFQAIESGLQIGQVFRTENDVYCVGCGESAVTLKEVTFEKKTYTEANFADLFGGGGQRLGVPS